MSSSAKLLAVIGGVIAFTAMVLYPQSMQGGQRSYEIHPQVTIPEYRTDTLRIVDSYEQLIERYMDLSERDLFDIGANVRVVVKKLDSIDGKLNQLSVRIAEIEKVLGIEQDEPTAEKKVQPKASNIKVRR